jgi:DnaK suppressor protein
MSIDPHRLQLIRSVLAQRHRALTNRSERIHHTLHRQGEPISADFAEQALQTENDEPLEVIDDATRAQLRAVNDAIRRIDAGAYGSCRICDRLISTARLEAIPYATTCVDCEAQRDPTARQSP